MRIVTTMFAIMLAIACSAAFANGDDSRGKFGHSYHDGSSKRPISVVIKEGSLKKNVDRIAGANGWPKVVWQPKHDYQ